MLVNTTGASAGRATLVSVIWRVIRYRSSRPDDGPLPAVPHPVRGRRLHARMVEAGGGHVAIGCAVRAGADAADRRARQAAYSSQRQCGLVGHPVLVAGAARRVALHRPGQADAERLCRGLQRALARRMPQRDAVHVAAAPPVRARCLAARLQPRQAAPTPAEKAGEPVWGTPPDRLPSPQPTIMKEPGSTSDW